MKECRECDFFKGYDYSDGTPMCEYDGGYENCPYCDSANVKQSGFKIEIDAGFMHDYIVHTLKNTMKDKTDEIARQEIRCIITENMKEEVLGEMRAQVTGMVSEELDSFMQKEIKIGGGWAEEERALTRTQYLSELIEDELGKRFKKDELRRYAENATRNAIDKFDSNLRNEINDGIKKYFDQATRQILTDNVVSMLMNSETYKRLEASMQNFLPGVDK